MKKLIKDIYNFLIEYNKKNIFKQTDEYDEFLNNIKEKYNKFKIENIVRDYNTLNIKYFNVSDFYRENRFNLLLVPYKASILHAAGFIVFKQYNISEDYNVFFEYVIDNNFTELKYIKFISKDKIDYKNINIEISDNHSKQYKQILIMSLEEYIKNSDLNIFYEYIIKNMNKNRDNIIKSFNKIYNEMFLKIKL